MSQELEPAGASRLDVLRANFGPKARDEELAYFAQVARHLDVDPFAGHICLLPHYDRDVGGTVYKPTLTVAGRRAIAQRTGRLRGIDGPWWCPPRRYDQAGARLPLEWLELWDSDDGYPYAARTLVHVDGWTVPANGTVKWSEFSQWTRKGDRDMLLPTWGRMPSFMLGKTSEALALRRGFPEVQAAISYLGGDTDDEATIAREVEAESVDARRQIAGSPPEATSGASGRRRSDDSPPTDYYDQLPEARGWAGPRP
jgi:hypothetical protein